MKTMPPTPGQISSLGPSPTGFLHILPKVLKRAGLLVIFVASPALAATDGQPGPTSTGSFNASINVQAPGGTTVRVTGLDDFDLGTAETSETKYTPLPNASGNICLLRSDAGPVRVNITQNNLPASETFFALQGTNDGDGNGVIDAIPILFTVINPSQSAQSVHENSDFELEQSDPSCTENASFPIAHGLSVYDASSELPPASISPLSGVFTAQFTMTVSIP
jgi:hypothetical protein